VVEKKFVIRFGMVAKWAQFVMRGGGGGEDGTCCE